MQLSEQRLPVCLRLAWGGLLRWTGLRLRKHLSPTAETVSCMPRILNGITPTSANEYETKRESAALRWGMKSGKKTVTFILKREEFVCFLVSFHVCVYILHVRALRTHRVIFFSFCLCSFIAACTSSSLHFHVATDHGYSSRNEGPVWAVYISLTAQKHWHQLTELCWNDWWRSGQQLARRPQA